MGFFNSLLSALGAFVVGILFIISAAVGNFIFKTTYNSPTPLPARQQTTPTQTKVSATPAATSSPAKTKPQIKTLPKPTSTLPAPSVVTNTPAAPASTAADVERVNAAVRSSLVNILCTTKAGGSFAPISGSGIIIDSRGVIITNAHVGQFFLIRNYITPDNIVCVVRTGSPAVAAYNAELLYLPPLWISANASQILSSRATGTGENDYAFLLIQSPTQPGAILPVSFSTLPMNIGEPAAGTSVLLAGYPAGLLGGIEIQTNLYASSALAVVQELFSFGNTSNIDVVSLGGTVVAQSGSSGGAVVRMSDSKLLGLIATESEGTTTSSRTLYAITLAHINRSLATEGQGDIVTLLSGDLQKTAADFNKNIAPGLEAELTAQLKKATN